MLQIAPTTCLWLRVQPPVRARVASAGVEDACVYVFAALGTASRVYSRFRHRRQLMDSGSLPFGAWNLVPALRTGRRCGADAGGRAADDPPGPVRRHPHQPPRLAYVRFAVGCRAFACDPPRVPAGPPRARGSLQLLVRHLLGGIRPSAPRAPIIRCWPGRAGRCWYHPPAGSRAAVRSTPSSNRRLWLSSTPTA